MIVGGDLTRATFNRSTLSLAGASTLTGRKPVSRDLSHSSLSCSTTNVVLPRPPEEIPASIYSMKSADPVENSATAPGGPMDLNIGNRKKHINYNETN